MNAPVASTIGPRPHAPEADEIRLIGVTLHARRNQEVFGEGEPADHVYRVVRGAVRGLRLLPDGRRQICDFYLPGDVFGVERDAQHRLTAETVTDSVLVAARRSSLFHDGDPATARRLWGLAMRELGRGRDHALTLGRRSAMERVADFLIEMAERLGDGRGVELPMSRQDIADYLGLTVETVSRTLTQLQGGRVIELSGCRSVRLRERAALEALRA